MLRLLKIQVTASSGQIFSATFTRAQCSLVFDIWLGEDLQAAGRTVILREARCYHNGFQKSSKRGRTAILTKGEEEEEGGGEQHRSSSL